MFIKNKHIKYTVFALNFKVAQVKNSLKPKALTLYLCISLCYIYEAFHFPFGVPQVSDLVPFHCLSVLVPLDNSLQVLHTPSVCGIHPDIFINRILEFWLQHCGADWMFIFSAQVWMNGVILKLNPNKSESIINGDKHTCVSLIPYFPESFLQSFISPREEVKI